MDRLEDVLRAGESSDDLVLLLRGGEDTSAKLLRQAALFEARYIYGGQSARGMSLFAASSVVDALAVLESKLRTYRSTAGARGGACRNRSALADVPSASLDRPVPAAWRSPSAGDAIGACGPSGDGANLRGIEIDFCAYLGDPASGDDASLWHGHEVRQCFQIVVELTP